MLYKQSVCCPECKKVFSITRGGMVDTPFAEIVCPHCGHKFSLLDKIMSKFRMFS